MINQNDQPKFDNQNSNQNIKNKKGRKLEVTTKK